MEISERKIAIIGGVSLLIMALLAGFSYGFVFSDLIVLDNVKETIKNLQRSNFLFQLSIYAWLLIFILDIIVAWSFYVFLEKVNPQLSLLSAWLRLFYTCFLGIAISCLVIVLLLINQEISIETEKLVLLFIHSFLKTWSIGLIIFGLHLLLLGYLVFKAEYIPSIFGILLMFGGFLYFTHSSADFLFVAYSNYKEIIEMVINLPMAASELSIAIWLLIKGAKAK